jgi:hypothetical protein
VARRELRGLYIKGLYIKGDSSIPGSSPRVAEQRAFEALSVCAAEGHNLAIMSHLVQRNLRSDSSIL